MGVNKHRGRIVCDKRWPDGGRFTRVCANKTIAKQLLARIEVSISDGTWQDLREQLKLRDRDTLTLNDFAETYIEDYAKVRNKKKAWKRKVTSLRFLKQHLGTLELDQITPARLHAYAKARKKGGVKNATINRDLTTIKHLLSYAVECGLISDNPVEKFRSLKEEQKERPRFTDEQVQAVIDELRADVRPVFIFIRETGCRREEALSLQPWQVHEESCSVVFSDDMKSRKYRYVPLTDAALEAVQTLPKLADCDYVFYNWKTKNRWFDCRKHWEKAREAAGVPGIQIKDLRRLYAIKLAESGASMHDIQQVLGHASVATTEKHYAQFAPDHSARRIFKVLQGGKSETDTKRRHDLRSAIAVGEKE